MSTVVMCEHYLWLVLMLAGRGRSAAFRVCVSEGVKAPIMLLVKPAVTDGKCARLIHAK